VYGDNAMSDGMARKWVWMFNEGREKVHDEVQSGHPSLVNDTVSSHLGFWKVCARWVTKITEKHKKQHVACALTFLMCYHKEGDGMLSHIVTGDEIWVSHITLESKQQVLALEAYWLTKNEKVQADVFNKEDHVHCILGQTRCSLGRIFAPRHNNKLCCLL